MRKSVKSVRKKNNQENLVSIIVPCRNEERFILKCLRSIKLFKLPEKVKIEILVVDGRSTDRTLKIIKKVIARNPSIRLLDNPGITQSSALNIGLSAARGGRIMRLDAHTLYPPDYLEKCYETAVRTKADNVGGICITEPGGRGYQAQLVQALTTHKFGVGNSGFRTSAKEGPKDTVPFGFFDRKVFYKIGLFDERLIRAQDYEFNRRIIALGGVVWLNPKIKSRYFNQKSISDFYCKQFLKEAPYNAYMWYLAPYSFTPRHAITGIFTTGVLGGIMFAPLFPVAIGIPFAGVMSLYFILAIFSSIQQTIRYKKLMHLFILPFAFFFYHFIHGLGLLTGLLRLATCTSPVQKVNNPLPGAGMSPKITIVK